MIIQFVYSATPEHCRTYVAISNLHKTETEEQPIDWRPRAKLDRKRASNFILFLALKTLALEAMHDTELKLKPWNEGGSDRRLYS